ncbi:Regulator of vps4 activity in the mvb pathway protein [Thalictrum thalictroides]|uniref:Regulator of vps4 activity in the mvb pathway protein n=1 Tax=Thalictrum thalictroides TaxID=46969 RepID=A0A7J6V9A2_THATH|nr:Regulator of vps4 activity in the mvb pathway protein [Thalictrum thalictroides]
MIFGEHNVFNSSLCKVEHVVREEKTMAAYDLIDIYCELVVARLPIIESQKNCPIDLKEAVSSIVFASPRCADIPELLDARKHFTTKYGKDFITCALELRPECGVNRLMVEKLSARAPDGQTKLKILTEIAKEHNVEWDSEAFGEKELKPPEDLLNGPRVTGYSSGGPAEPLVNDLPPYSQKPEPSYMKDITGSSQSSQTSDPAIVRTPNVTIHSFKEASGDAADGREFERRSYQDVNSYTPNRENWNMEFKDATSAARAAAESAERASFAAQAAAKLANFNEVTGKHSTGSRETLMQDQQRYRYEKESKQGVSDNMLDSHNITRRKSSQSASSGSGTNNVEDDPEKTDIYCQKCSSEVEDLNNSRHIKKSEESNIQSSHIAEEFLNHQPHIERPGHTNSMKEDIRNNSMKSSSDDDNGDVFLSNLQKYDRENSYGSIAKGDPQSGSKQPSFNDYPSPVFDEPVSDDETTEHIYGVYNPSPGRSSPSRISENVNTWSPHKHRGTSLEEVPNVQSHFNTQSSASEFSGTRSKTLSPSRSGDLLPATFDDSDGQDSESEGKIDANPSGRIESSGRRHQQNSFNISPESAHSPISSVLEKEVKLVSRRSYMDSSSEDSDSDGAYPVRNQEMDVNVGGVSGQNKHRLGDSLDIRPSRTSNTLVDDKKISYNPMVEEKQRPQQSSRYSLTKDIKTGGDLIAPSSPDNVKDPGMFNYMNSESGQELDFGRLRGGFRNKGYTRPPYHKGLSEDNSPVTRTEHSKKKLNVSSVVEDQKHSETHNQESSNQRPHAHSHKETSTRNRKTIFDSDSDDADVISPQTVSSAVEDQKHSETHNQESSNQRPHAHSHKETSSRNRKTIFDSDSDDADVISPQTVGSRGKSGARISRRTRESPALSNVSTYTSTSGSGATITSVRDEISPRIVNPTQTLPSPKAKTGSSQNKSSFRTNISVGKNPEPELQSRYGEKSKLAGSSISVDHHQSKFTPRTDLKQSSKPSSDSSTNETLKKSNLNKESVSRENSDKKGGHVHPKLPDYDTFAAHFESLRSSR